VIAPPIVGRPASATPPPRTNPAAIANRRGPSVNPAAAVALLAFQLMAALVALRVLQEILWHIGQGDTIDASGAFDPNVIGHSLEELRQ
jgi:hypothetical protein